MDYGTVTGIEKPVSRIVFGTDRLRGRRRSWLANRSLEQQAFSLLDQSFELGCNSFDTARIYGDSERTLGARIRQRRNRDKGVVISKGCHPDSSGNPRLSPSDVSHDLRASLKALGPHFIDTIRGRLVNVCRAPAVRGGAVRASSGIRCPGSRIVGHHGGE